jgi:macrolide transport system ATP-binding/permease protein
MKQLMSGTFVRFEAVSFSYEASQEELFSGIELELQRGWTGIVGANGAGKTTLLRLATGQLHPTVGRRIGAPHAVYCAQRTDDAPPQLGELLGSAESEACRLKGRLELREDWAGRWGTLSHGERKRAQVAVALWQQPDLLAIDEPTNHLDIAARALIEQALGAYEGVGLLVSHDRALLDKLCQQCAFLDGPRVVRRPGGYSDGRREALREREESRRARARADRQVTALQAEASVRREQSLKNERQRSKRGLDKNDHDGRARINLAKVTDGGSGQRLRQLDGRLALAEERKREIVVGKEPILGIALPGERAPKEKLAFAEPAKLALGPARSLAIPALVLHRSDRIGLQGPNGSGKTTLLRHLIGVVALPPSRYAYLPQEIDAGQSRAVLAAFRALPRDELGAAMGLVSRLGSRPERLLRSETPSPGEVRKMLLASSIVSNPYLIVLDEPTNHLDLPSIEALEEALAGTRAALVIVSHDRRFLGRLTQTMWTLEPGAANGDWKVVAG